MSRFSKLELRWRNLDFRFNFHLISFWPSSQVLRLIEELSFKKLDEHSYLSENEKQDKLCKRWSLQPRPQLKVYGVY